MTNRDIQSHRGFTLVELLVVIAVIAILSGILVPAVMSAYNTAQTRKTKMIFARIEGACEQYYADWGEYPPATDVIKLLIGPDDGDGVPGPGWRAGGSSAFGGKTYGPYGDLLDIFEGQNFIDSWGNPIEYKITGSADDDTQRIELYSNGPDGEKDNAGDDDSEKDDITNKKDD